MKISVVLNRMAGSLLGRPAEEAVAAIETAFQAAGHQIVCAAVSGEALETEIRNAAAGDADVVMVGGGDGTIATAAHILTGTGKALGVLPLGTMNLLARDLGLPLDLPAAIAALADGEIAAIDMAEVNGRPVLNNSVIGLYARMVQEREHQRGIRNISKWPAMGLAFLKTLIDYPRLEVELDLDGGRRRVLTPILAVANNAYDRGLGPVPTRSNLSAGILAVYIGRHRSRLHFLRLFGRFVTGAWIDDPDLEVHLVKEVSVHARRRMLRVANDGEVHWTRTPLHYRIVPDGLRVLRPRRDAAGEPLLLRTSA